jgi:hypothetical protein
MGGPMKPPQQGRSVGSYLQRAVDAFGEDGFMDLMDEVMKQVPQSEYAGREPIDTTMMPPPDFGDQQPVTTLPPTDENMMGLEDYYGYPSKVVQPDTPGGRQVNNSYPGMQQNVADQMYTKATEAQYMGRGENYPGATGAQRGKMGRRLPKGRTRLAQ